MARRSRRSALRCSSCCHASISVRDWRPRTPRHFFSGPVLVFQRCVLGAEVTAADCYSVQKGERPSAEAQSEAKAQLAQALTAIDGVIEELRRAVP